MIELVHTQQILQINKKLESESQNIFFCPTSLMSSFFFSIQTLAEN